MGKSLQKMICNGLFLSDGGMIHSTFFAGKSSSCRAANSLYQVVLYLQYYICML